MATITCPYCWAKFAQRDLHHQCGQNCKGEAKTFPAGQLKGGKCPHGRPPQARRSCPRCDKPLLREFLESDGTSIAVIGSADAGKTTWVAALIRQLAKGQVRERFPGLSVDLLGEESRIRYQRDFEAPLFDEGRPLRQTVSARVAAPEPLIFSLRFPKRKVLRTSVTPVVTVFYDTAGEDVARSTGMDELAAYLNAARGIILLLDPMQMPQVRVHVNGAKPSRTAYTEQLHVLNRLSELLRETSKGSMGRKHATPLAIGLTKVDLLRDTFDAQSPLRLPSRHDGHYDDDDGVDVHEDIRAWLDKWYDPSFDRSVANNFATHRYFGISALGAPPVDGNRLAATGVHSYRVEDPMLWLLARFNVIKTVRGNR